MSEFISVCNTATGKRIASRTWVEGLRQRRFDRVVTIKLAPGYVFRHTLESEGEFPNLVAAYEGSHRLLVCKRSELQPRGKLTGSGVFGVVLLILEPEISLKWRRVGRFASETEAAVFARTTYNLTNLEKAK